MHGNADLSVAEHGRRPGDAVHQPCDTEILRQALLQNIIITEIGHGTVLFRFFFIITDLQDSCKSPRGIANAWLTLRTGHREGFINCRTGIDKAAVSIYNNRIFLIIPLRQEQEHG
jgi:hypothetical protein